MAIKCLYEFYPVLHINTLNVAEMFYIVCDNSQFCCLRCTTDE